MKKKLLSLLIAFTCAAMLFSGCGLGSYVQTNPKEPPKTEEPDDTENPDNPDDTENPDNPDDPDNPAPPVNNNYTVSVYYNNTLFNPGDTEINVVWRGSNVIRVPLGADGKADAGELDGDYAVYLEGLPTKYSYNPSAYNATDKERKVTILLTDIKAPESGDGKGLYRDDGCYLVKKDGTYRANITYDGEYVYYEYTPTSAGWYSIESWVNVYEDELNPVLVAYSGSTAYKFNPVTFNDGGFSVSGGFTRNFRYDCKIDKTEIGNTFTIAVTGESKMMDYPAYVDFAITYIGEYQSDYNDVRVIRAKEARIKAAEKKPDETFVYADLGTKTFAMSYVGEDKKEHPIYAYNEDTGFYHRYDDELYADDQYGYGEGFGPILCCVISKSVPCYSVTTLYDANAVGGPDLCFNYLKLYNCWIEEEQKYATYDYTDFIRIDYYGKCNSEGVCYVTQELKEFLQKYAENHALYTDGVGAEAGSPEDKGYFAKQDALWLFACGYYDKVTG